MPAPHNERQAVERERVELQEHIAMSGGARRPNREDRVTPATAVEQEV